MKLYAALNLQNQGYDGQTFTLIFEDNKYQINDIITWDLSYGDFIYICSNGYQYGLNYLYECCLVGKHINQESVIDPRGLIPGTIYTLIDQVIGEY